MSAANLISFLLVVSLLVSVSSADNTKDISESVTEDSVEEAARKALLLKQNAIDLCQNFDGCTCDGKHEKANCSGIITKDRQLKMINFTNVTIPKSIVKVKIVDCPFVEIAQTKLADLAIKSLIIARVKELRIGPGSLKQVNVLNLENIGKLEYDKDVLTELKADTVTFINVTFPIGDQLVLRSIKSELKLVQCNLTDFTLIVESPQTDRSVSIDDSYLDRLSLKIKTGTFTMNKNQFVRLSSKLARLMDIQYSHSMNLTNNQFGISNAISVLPDVMSSNESLTFYVSPNLSVESKEWLEHFSRLEFIGTTSTGVTSRGRISCDEHHVNEHHDFRTNAPERQIICPNIKSLSEFLKTETKATTHSSHHQPDKQIKIQTHDNVEALGVSVHHKFPALVRVGLIVITCGKMLNTFV